MQKIKEKVTNIVGMEIMEERLQEMRRKEIILLPDWSAPGVDETQNYWWNKFNGVRKSMLASMKRWIEDPEQH